MVSVNISIDADGNIVNIFIDATILRPRSHIAESAARGVLVASGGLPGCAGGNTKVESRGVDRALCPLAVAVVLSRARSKSMARRLLREPQWSSGSSTMLFSGIYCSIGLLFYWSALLLHCSPPPSSAIFRVPWSPEIQCGVRSPKCGVQHREHLGLGLCRFQVGLLSPSA